METISAKISQQTWRCIALQREDQSTRTSSWYLEPSGLTFDWCASSRPPKVTLSRCPFTGRKEEPRRMLPAFAITRPICARPSAPLMQPRLVEFGECRCT
eukprot:25785-Rhodomonas_salina.1